MTINNAYAQFKNLKPNTVEYNVVVRWLSQVEHMVKRLVIDTHEGGESVPFTSFDDDVDGATELFMPEPFDKAYLYWLEAQMHYYNEDIDMYNSAVLMFNTVFNEYKAFYGRNHISIGAGRFRF